MSANKLRASQKCRTRKFDSKQLKEILKSALIQPLHTILFSCHLKTEISHVFICQHFWYSGVQTQNKSLCSFLASLSWRRKFAGLFSCCSRGICFLYNSSLSLIDNCAYLTTLFGRLDYCILSKMQSHSMSPNCSWLRSNVAGLQQK